MVKKSKDKKLKPQRSIRFEIEDNAEEIFKNAIDNTDFLPKSDPPKSIKSSKNKRKSEFLVSTVDLHGMRLAEAIKVIESVVQNFLASTLNRASFRIVTGKGLHSQGGQGVLSFEIHRYICQHFSQYIESIQESPAAVKISNVPIRGHFDLVLKK